MKFPYVSLQEELLAKTSNHIPLSNDYILYCIWLEPQERTHVTVKKYKTGVVMTKTRPYMSDEEVNAYLAEHGELGFDDMPSWLRLEVKARNLIYDSRQPTEMEQWETVSDAREHRIVNKELTQKDFSDKYRRGKSLTLIT
tara:strand:+ start:189 stop:611 length:423 start_codon:yes stop_codon:yes gene_type:complete